MPEVEVHVVPANQPHPAVKPNACYLVEDLVEDKVGGITKKLTWVPAWLYAFFTRNIPRKKISLWRLSYVDEHGQKWQVPLKKVNLLETILQGPPVTNRLKIAKKVIELHYKYYKGRPHYSARVPGIAVLGDSLSEEGLADGNQYGFIRRKLFGLISIRRFYPFYCSPYGAFTNGLPYSIFLEDAIFSKNPTVVLPALPKLPAIGQMEHNQLKETLAVWQKIPQQQPSIQKTTAASVSKKKQNRLINYAQGGATAFNYSSLCSFLKYWKAIFVRLVVTHLSAEVRQYEDDGIKVDHLHSIWIGANDLITIGYTNEAGINRAITSIQQAIEHLIKHKARYYLLGTLPSIGSTPRYRNKTCEFYSMDENPSPEELKKGKKYQHAYIFGEKHGEITLTQIEKGIIQRSVKLSQQNSTLFNEVKSSLVGSIKPYQPLKDLLPYEAIDKLYLIARSTEGCAPSRSCERGYQQQKAIDKCVDHFNEKLGMMVESLRKKYKEEYFPPKIEVFKYADAFTDILKGSSYQPFTDSCTPYIDTTTQDYKLGQPVSSKGMVYYDDVHPTADMHAELGEKLYQFVKQHYHVKQPDEQSYQLRFFRRHLHDDTRLAGPMAWEQRIKKYGRGSYEI